MRSYFVSGLVLLSAAAIACASHSSQSDTNGNGSSTSSALPGGGSSSTANSQSTGSSESTASTSGSSIGGGTGDAGPAGPLAALHVQGNQIVDANGKTVVLRGVAIPDIGTLFSQGGGIAGVTGRIDEILGAAGLAVRAVRLPAYPRKCVNGLSPYYSPVPYPVGPAVDAGTQLSASDYIAQVLKPAVDYATSKNLYAIIDYHQIDNVTTGTSSADAVTFWNTVAPVFAGYSNVLYEAFNEPIDTSAGITAGGWSTAFTTAAQSWITAIRAGAPNNVIVVGSPSWSQHPEGALTANLTGGNLVFTAHIYPSNWPGKMNAFQTNVATAAMSVPVAITEWGYELPDGGDRSLSEPDAGWAPDLQSFINSGGESWTAWVADPSWGPPMFTKATGADVNSLNGLNDFGTFVKTWLAATP
jgi:hypothetical protein